MDPSPRSIRCLGVTLILPFSVRLFCTEYKWGLRSQGKEVYRNAYSASGWYSQYNHPELLVLRNQAADDKRQAGNRSVCHFYLFGFEDGRRK